MSTRRAARAATATTAADSDIPADLAAGPCVEVWADPGHAPNTIPALHTARRNWRAARDAWMRDHGLNPTDHHHMPAALRDRAPYERNTR